MKNFATNLLKIFSSLWLSCTLLILLGLLTWLGTLEQVHTGLFDVQKKYFESYLLWHDLGPLSIPLPGANLVMSVLFINLVLGGILRLRKSWDTAGVMITHIGILMMLAAGFIKNYYSVEGHVTLFEGDELRVFQSYYHWELVVLEDLGGDEVREHVITDKSLNSYEGAKEQKFTSAQLPFDVVLTRFLRNSWPMPKGPMFQVNVPVVDGVFLKELPPEKEAEHNQAGAYVTVVSRDGKKEEGIVWGSERGPWTFFVNGKRYAMTLHRERYPMPFALRLDKFTKEDHPRTTMAKVYASDVTVSDGASKRSLKISMNEPLRDKGLVVYQASWGPSNAQPGDPLYSTLAVVQNPADQFPLYSCLVIAFGLLVHFLRKLLFYVRSQVRKT